MQLRDFLVWWQLAPFVDEHPQAQLQFKRPSLWPVIEAEGWQGQDSAKDLLNEHPEFQLSYFSNLNFQRRANVVIQQKQFITRFDSEYPQRLSESKQPPLVLFYQVNLTLLHQLTLGIVGARLATEYTVSSLKQLLYGLPPGLVIISGMAKGADGMAHRFALGNGLPTIAVVATGLDLVYPKENRALFRKITENGLVLSEYPPQTPAQSWHFVARNRIIAGLSHGLLVTEARAKSGSLITANYALQNNREVFAFPNLTTAELGEGTNQLIQAGAKLVLTGADIAEELHFYD